MPVLRFHVITPVSRPENLTVVGRSLAVAAAGFDVSWHLKFDLERKCVGGYKLRNEMLDGIDDGWIWFLDDDTVVHPELFREASSIVLHDSSIRVIVFSQQRPQHRLPAKPENVRVGKIDTGQPILKREVIGAKRFKEALFADGLLYSDLLQGEANVFYSPKLLSLFNSLRPDARL